MKMRYRDVEFYLRCVKQKTTELQKDILYFGIIFTNADYFGQFGL